MRWSPGGVITMLRRTSLERTLLPTGDLIPSQQSSGVDSGTSLMRRPSKQQILSAARILAEQWDADGTKAGGLHEAYRDGEPGSRT